jgi:hypothetical protein
MPQQQRRSRFILGVLALGLLAGAALTAGSAQAVDAVGPYYAEPAWDQSLPVATRFVVLTNWGSQAVLDKETGLVWERSPSLTLSTWHQARLACTGRTTGNRRGWRLPSIPELTSLVDPSVAPPGPTLPLGHPFPTVQSAFYWSASTVAVGSSGAWGVGFDGGGVFSVSKAFATHAWCVRGGMNADAY